MTTALWHCESGSFALQNLRFYRAKEPLLERKTIGFAKCLITRQLDSGYCFEKYLHFIYSSEVQFA